MVEIFQNIAVVDVMLRLKGPCHGSLVDFRLI